MASNPADLNDVQVHADAFIEPVRVTGAQYIQVNVPFMRNFEPGLLGSSFLSTYKNVASTSDLWSVHLLAGWQGDTETDNDPGEIDLLYGLAYAPDNYGVIYVETVREGELYIATPRTVEEHTVVHEFGHQGESPGDHSDGGIMLKGAPVILPGSSPPRANDAFRPITIRRFRENRNY